MKLSVRHILSIRDLTKKDVALILQTADSFLDISNRPIKKVPTLRGKTVINCFFEDSTRTRLSFEIAEKRLSADTVNITKSGSAMAAKGETLIDTVKNIEAMNPDIIIIRHNASGAPAQVAKFTKAHVINAGDGMHEHPTQALLDLMTIKQSKGRLGGINVGIVGDILHSRVARSDMLLFTKMGLNVFVFGPKTLIPPKTEEVFGVEVVDNLERVLPKLDVLMLLRVQKERLSSNFFPSMREYAIYYGINSAKLGGAKKGLVIMHPGPVNRGIELSAEVADGRHSLILDQVTNGVAVRMALLYLLSGEDKEGKPI